MLVPPAPSAVSNSSLLSWPSASASICANRSFRISDLPVDAPVDWPCAASNALMVSGDICEPPLDPEGGVEAVEAEAAPERSNGFVASLRLPVECEEDDFDELSDLSA